MSEEDRAQLSSSARVNTTDNAETAPDISKPNATSTGNDFLSQSHLAPLHFLDQPFVVQSNTMQIFVGSITCRAADATQLST